MESENSSPRPAILVREYESSDGGVLRIAVSAPYELPTCVGRSKCDYIIQTRQNNIKRTVEGVDGLHALLICLSSIKRWISEAEIVDPMTVRWTGADEWGDLGFSIPS